MVTLIFLDTANADARGHINLLAAANADACVHINLLAIANAVACVDAFRHAARDNTENLFNQFFSSS